MEVGSPMPRVLMYWPPGSLVVPVAGLTFAAWFLWVVLSYPPKQAISTDAAPVAEGAPARAAFVRPMRAAAKETAWQHALQPEVAAPGPGVSEKGLNRFLYAQLRRGMTAREVRLLFGRPADAKARQFSLLGIGRHGDPEYWLWAQQVTPARPDEPNNLERYPRDGYLVGDKVLTGDVIGVSFDENGRVDGGMFSPNPALSDEQFLQRWLAFDWSLRWF
jgi:hypothetical protein